jgi:hypothetical protein
MNSTDLRIESMLTALKAQGIFGRTHLYIAKGLIAAKSTVLTIAPKFFEMTLDAHLQAVQIYAAKLYDKNSKSVTVELFVRKAARSEAHFLCAKPSDVRGAVEIARLMITNLKPSLEALQIRRNEYLAHVDPMTVIDIASMHVRAALTIADLDSVLVETTNILNLFSQLLDGTLSVPMLQGADDYEVILKLAATSAPA